jgi:hypothetical protein
MSGCCVIYFFCGSTITYPIFAAKLNPNFL